MAEQIGQPEKVTESPNRIIFLYFVSVGNKETKKARLTRVHALAYLGFIQTAMFLALKALPLIGSLRPSFPTIHIIIRSVRICVRVLNSKALAAMSRKQSLIQRHNCYILLQDDSPNVGWKSTTRPRPLPGPLR